VTLGVPVRLNRAVGESAALGELLEAQISDHAWNYTAFGLTLQLYGCIVLPNSPPARSPR
jgi:hypothetical protein